MAVLVVAACSGEPTGTEPTTSSTAPQDVTESVDETASVDGVDPWADAILTYYGNNLFSAGAVEVTAETCEDPFGSAGPASTAEYWESFSPTSCFQLGAMPMTPPLYDCDDEILPEKPDDRDAIAGNRVVFDIRSFEILVAGHSIETCIPIG